MPLTLPLVLSIVVAVFKNRADLVAENIALRHQLSCLIHRRPRPKLRPVDRVVWVLLSRFWNCWTKTLVMVKPATVLAWHRQAFKLFWRWKSRKRGPGRPRIPEVVCKLIVEMAEMNAGLGRPSNSRRVAQARYRDIRNHRFTLHAEAPSCGRFAAAMDNFSAQPSTRGPSN